MQTTIKTAKSTQTAIPEIGKTETTLYYLIIGEDKKNVVINIGTKTFNKVNELINGATSNGKTNVPGKISK